MFSLNTKRTLHSASLRPDGTVLGAGGTTPKKGVSILNLVEIRSPAGAWAAAASMTGRRFQQTSTTLQDGRVLVVGGVADTGSLLNSVEVFATGWSQAAPMTTARAGHTATLLKDGGGLGGRGVAAGRELMHLPEFRRPTGAHWKSVSALGLRRDGMGQPNVGIWVKNAPAPTP